MKDPAFLFYPNDFLGGTLGMTLEQKGAYVELLILQFNRGHMTTHMIGQTVGQLWEPLKDKFKVDENGNFYNQRLEDEINKRKTYCESRRNNKEGKNQYSKTNPGDKPAAALPDMVRSYDHPYDLPMTSHTVGHMENENENEIQHTNNLKSIGKGVQRENNTPYTRWSPNDTLVITHQADEAVNQRIEKDIQKSK